MVRMQRVLVPVDFSEPSEKAVQYGIELARRSSATVFFLHVLDQRIIDAVQAQSNRGYKGEFLQGLRRVIQDRDNDLKQFIAPEQLEGIEAEFLVRRGEPADEVINAAKELSIDLIVVGSRGYSDTMSPSLGNVVQQVVNFAPCPVLLVRPFAHDLTT